MSNKKPAHSFKAGNTHAKDNGNQARRRVRKSKLRKTEEALRKLEPKSLENIEKSVNGVEVDKESLMTSKWVITNIMAVGKAAALEEDLLNGLRLEMDKAEAEEQEKEEAEKSPTGAVFSLFVNEAKSKDKE